MAKKKDPDQIPRFVLQLSDTHTTMTGPSGEQYMSVTIASDKLFDFYKHIPEKKRKNLGENEFEALLLFFQEQVEKSDLERDKGGKVTFKADK